MASPKELEQSASRAADFLKVLSNPNRLMILCLLAEQELSVGELEEALDIRQPTLSQQLAVLREHELVTTRRSGKCVFYRLGSRETARIIEVLYELFCSPQADAAGTKGGSKKAEPASVG